MEKRQMLPAMGLQLSLLVVLLASSCAQDGSLAGRGKPVDFERTRVAMCKGAQSIDVTFQTIGKAAPGRIPSKVMDAEGNLIYDIGFAAGDPSPARDGSLCAAVYVGDLNVAINTVIATITNVSVLVQKWKEA